QTAPQSAARSQPPSPPPTSAPPSSWCSSPHAPSPPSWTSHSARVRSSLRRPPSARASPAQSALATAHAQAAAAFARPVRDTSAPRVTSHAQLRTEPETQRVHPPSPPPPPTRLSRVKPQLALR